MADLLHVTKDGIVTGDYWGGIKKVEKEKEKSVLDYREQNQVENYHQAIKEKPPSIVKKARKKKRVMDKPSMYDLHGKKIEKLYDNGRGISQRDIAAKLKISYSTVNTILKRRLQEKDEEE